MVRFRLAMRQLTPDMPPRTVCEVWHGLEMIGEIVPGEKDVRVVSRQSLTTEMLPFHKEEGVAVHIITFGKR